MRILIARPRRNGTTLQTRREMRILIIGGTRFIGPCVVRRLARDGHEVIVYDTNAIRRELGYREEIPERDAMRDLCRGTYGWAAVHHRTNIRSEA